MITTIDSNPTITYSEVNKVFREVDKYRAKFLKQGHRELTLPFKKYKDSYDMEIYFLYLAGVQIEIVIPLSDDWYRSSVYFKWKSLQVRRNFYVGIETRPSNLGKGEVGYFNFDGRICRKLYTDGLSLFSRYDFNKIYYHSQSVGDAQRIALGWNKAERKAEEAELHNQTYKGKPTRWAIKAEREAAKANYYAQAADRAMIELLGRKLR